MHVSIGLGLVNLVIQCYDKKIKIRILGFLGGRKSGIQIMLRIGVNLEIHRELSFILKSMFGRMINIVFQSAF
jgi:hypothetical protein